MPELVAKVLTVSDGVVDGTREDKSGAALVDTLTAAGFAVTDRRSAKLDETTFRRWGTTVGRGRMKARFMTLLSSSPLIAVTRMTRAVR